VSPAALAVLAFALVAEDGTALRASPSDTAPAQAMLYRGDWLEVRGEAPGFLKVWDHRRERGGYIRPATVRVHRPAAGGAGELAVIVRFLREAPGFESLGIGYAALYMKVAPAEQRARPEWAEVLSALGEMAERLGRRASGATGGRTPDAVLAGQVAVAESYGVVFRRFERGTRTVVCYDGDAFGRVLQLGAAVPELRARAALALTRRGCFDPAAPVAQRRTWNDARVDILAALDPALASGAVPGLTRQRLHLRAAEALADRAHDEAAQTRPATAAAAASESLRRLALVDRGALAPEDLPTYEETAVRVAAIRWLADLAPPRTPRPPVAVSIAPGRPGQTCIRLSPPASPSPSEHCTHAVVQPSSLRISPTGRTVALAVAPVPGWSELWIFRADPTSPGGWRSEVLPPGPGEPGQDLGYVEPAGFTPDGRQLLIARELRTAARLTRRFELLAPDASTVAHWTSLPDHLVAFRRWASPTWRQTTLSLR
jgi:hypothetical protein